MQRKKLFWWIFGGVLTVAIFVTVLCVVFLRDTESNPRNINFTGVWRRYKYAADPIDNEYLVFDDASVKYYRSGLDGAAIESKYTYNATESKIYFSDLSMDFIVRYTTDYQISLLDKDNRDWGLAKISTSATVNAAPAIVGEWDVKLFNGTVPVKAEKVTFTETVMSDTRGGELYFSGDYTLGGNVLNVNLRGNEKTFEVYNCTSDVLIIVDHDDAQNGRYIWELKKC